MTSEAAIKNHKLLQIFCIIFGIFTFITYAASKFTPGKLVVVLTAVGFIGFFTALTLLGIRLKNFWKILSTAIISLSVIFIVSYILLFAFVYFFQDSIANKTSSFFQPVSISPEEAQSFLSSDISDIDLKTSDGIHLRGWLVRNSSETRTPLVIYFGGSGSESSEMIPFAEKLEGWSVALINYRGFGLSDGTPTQSNVLKDSLIIYDTLSERGDIDPKNIVAMGYSLGSGVAVYLSDQRIVNATILVSPYDYWTMIGLNQSPIYKPLSGIMTHYFDSISLASRIKNPMLCLTGSEDSVIPPAVSQRLADSWGGEVTYIEYPGEDHSLLFHNNNSSRDVLDFITEIGNR